MHNSLYFKQVMIEMCILSGDMYGNWNLHESVKKVLIVKFKKLNSWRRFYLFDKEFSGGL